MAQETSLFCIADPELKNLDPVGHCLGYDHTLAQAAMRAGYQPLILGRRTIEETTIGGVDMQPAFLYGLWERPSDDFPPGEGRDGVQSFLNFGKTIGEILTEGAPNQPLQTFLKLARIPRIANWLGYAFRLLRFPAEFGYIRGGMRFYSELKNSLAGKEVDGRSIILAQLVCGFQLFGWALFALYSAVTNGPKVAIILRFERKFYEGTPSSFRLLEPFARSGQLIYLTDSRRLAADYEPLTRVPLTVIPIPHTTPASEPRSFAQARRPGPLRFGTLGGARGDKGFEEVLGAIKILVDAGSTDNLAFVLHAHSPLPESTAKKLEAFRAHLPACASLIETTLSAEAYDAALMDLDVLLLPYQRDQYPSRTSGVLAEAMVAGKVCIVTADTWLSDELAEHGAGLECADRSPQALARAILEARDEFETLRRIAAERAESAARWHNSDRVIEIISARITSAAT